MMNWQSIDKAPPELTDMLVSVLGPITGNKYYGVMLRLSNGGFLKQDGTLLEAEVTHWCLIDEPDVTCAEVDNDCVRCPKCDSDSTLVGLSNRMCLNSVCSHHWSIYQRKV